MIYEQVQILLLIAYAIAVKASDKPIQKCSLARTFAAPTYKVGI